MGQAQGFTYSPGFFHAPEVNRHAPLVILNVYDLDENWLNMNGLLNDALSLGGAFHVGVEVFGIEWGFGYDGITSGRPRHSDVHVYRQSIPLGQTRLDKQDVRALIEDMESDWRGETYDILFKNCCAFSRELCSNILGRDRVPGWIDRLGRNLAELFGPVGMTGASTPAVLGPGAFRHTRQESTHSVASVESEASEYSQYSHYAGSEYNDGHDVVEESPMHRVNSYPHPFTSTSYPLATSSSFGNPYSLPGAVHGVRRFASTVY